MLLQRKYGVLFIVGAAFLLSFMDRFAWAPIIPIATRDLGLTATQAGSYMSAFYIGYVLTQLPGGVLADRYGYRKVILYSFAITGIFTILMGTVQSFGQGFVFRVLAGIGAGTIFSSSLRAIFDWFPQRGRSTAMGLVYS